MRAVAILALFLSLLSASYGGSSSCDIGQSWAQVPGNLQWVSSGSAGVFGVTSAYAIYYREGTYIGAKSYNYSYDSRNHGYSSSSGSGWRLVPGTLSQVDSGRDALWGTNRLGEIWRRIGISASNPIGTDWEKVDGDNVARVSVSDVDGDVWVLHRNGTVYRRNGTSPSLPRGASWEPVPGIAARSLDVGGAGVWATDTDDNVYFRTGSREECKGSGWYRVDGKLAQVASGGDAAWGVTQSGSIYFRLGITSTRPTGSDWIQVPGTLNQLSVATDNNAVWGVTSKEEIFRRLQ